MKIGINGYEAVVPRFGFDEETKLPRRVGSSEFCFQLLKGLNELASGNEFTTFLPVKPTYDLPKESSTWMYKVVLSKKLWTMLGLSKYFMSHKKSLDVFLSPTHYAPLYLPCPSVISILDLSYLYFPELFNKRDLYQLKMWGKYSLRRADAIITISESSKNDIIKEYKVDPARVHVVYLGIKDFKDKKTLSMSELSSKYSVSSPYILFVGTLQPRKNIARLIEAVSLLKNKDIKLVVIGKKGWKYEEILSAPQRFQISDRVTFLDNVTDEDLPSFYKNAQIFVLPSLYEGFGLPILEAMKYECPIATSNISSMPEAGGNAAVYFDPKDVKDISKTIEKVLDDKKLQEQMIKKGNEQIKKFSWKNTAKQTLEILAQVAQK